jgi:four helix bundle protein
MEQGQYPQESEIILNTLNEPRSSEYKPFDLEERIVEFAVSITYVIDILPDNKTCNHLGGQLLRSGTSPALNYGEAQGAESLKDFIHKFSICLKELRESKNNLTILKKRDFVSDKELMNKIHDESEQLIKIFKASIKTAQGKLKN